MAYSVTANVYFELSAFLYFVERKKLSEIKKHQQKEKQKQKMLQILGEGAPRDVDINTDEGFHIIEGLVEERMADKLVGELEKYLNPKGVLNMGASSVSMKRIFTQDMFSQAISRNTNTKNGFLSMIDEIIQFGREKKIKEKELEAKDRSNLEFKNDANKKKEDEIEAFDIAKERMLRSDLVSEDDMMEDLKKTVTDLTGRKKEEIAAMAKSDEYQKALSESMKEMVRETELEFGKNLDNVNQEDLTKFGDQLRDLMTKLDKAEEEIKRVNSEITKVQNIIEKDESALKHLEETIIGDGERDHLKHDNKRSVKKELREDDFDNEDVEKLEEDEDPEVSPFKDKSHDVKINVAEMSASTISGLKSSSAEDQSSLTKVGNKVSQRLESVIKSRLAKAGLDTGGRQIEVKLVTTASFSLDDDNDVDGQNSGIAGLFNEDESSQSGVTPEESQQFQDMIYNMMVSDRILFRRFST